MHLHCMLAHTPHTPLPHLSPPLPSLLLTPPFTHISVGLNGEQCSGPLAGECSCGQCHCSKNVGGVSLDWVYVRTYMYTYTCVYIHTCVYVYKFYVEQCDVILKLCY